MHTQKPASANESAELTIYYTSLCHHWIFVRHFPTSKLLCASICAWWCPMPQASGASQTWKLSMESWGPQWVKKDLVC